MALDPKTAEALSQALVRTALSNLVSASESRALLDAIEAIGPKEVAGRPLKQFIAERQRHHQRELLLKWEQSDPTIAAQLQHELSRHGDVWAD